MALERACTLWVGRSGWDADLLHDRRLQLLDDRVRVAVQLLDHFRILSIEIERSGDTMRVVFVSVVLDWALVLSRIRSEPLQRP